jgi:cell division protein FtsA
LDIRTSIWQEIPMKKSQVRLYATAVGLVMNSIENKTQSAVRIETTVVPEKVTFKQERTLSLSIYRKPLKKKFLKKVEEEVKKSGG